ncbi:MAG TPA: hypothetical protein VNJ01_11010 [Bacteriovoracaceae bacterium]|nr:hypothetical protein [Bacteriovoracaceae bacterium]
MSFKVYLLLFTLLCGRTLLASTIFTPESWSKGLHLLAGGGMNTSYYTSLGYQGKIGLGLNFKTDLGYYLNDRWALELSSTVKFNKLHDFLVWDTLFTFGVRYRVRDFFIRTFYGRAPTVFYSIDNTPLQFEERSVARLQYDGPVMGFGFGQMYLTDGGTNWFIELTATYQDLERVSLIGLKGEVPVVIEQSRQEDTKILGLIASVGVLVF